MALPKKTSKTSKRSVSYLKERLDQLATSSSTSGGYMAVPTVSSNSNWITGVTGNWAPSPISVQDSPTVTWDDFIVYKNAQLAIIKDQEERIVALEDEVTNLLDTVKKLITPPKPVGRNDKDYEAKVHLLRAQKEMYDKYLAMDAVRTMKEHKGVYNV